MAVPTWVKLAALAPAPACAILLYMDQNITTRLVNASKGLKKPGAYHLDMFWLSLITAVTSICGLPWICASTVHSLTHVKSLTDVKQDPATGREEVTGVTETRRTPRPQPPHRRLHHLPQGHSRPDPHVRALRYLLLPRTRGHARQRVP